MRRFEKVRQSIPAIRGRRLMFDNGGFASSGGLIIFGRLINTDCKFFLLLSPAYVPELQISTECIRLINLVLE